MSRGAVGDAEPTTAIQVMDKHAPQRLVQASGGVGCCV
jgi:hypothetical protein